MSINDPINYTWKWPWTMSDDKPTVNPLLKAMLQHNVDEMEKLFSMGATLSACNEDTLRRCIYIILGDYGVMHSLVQHGFSALYYDSDFSDDYYCCDDEGYCWGCLGRAWVLKKYNVLNLIAKNGFTETNVMIRRESYSLERLILESNDIKAAKILLENGFSRKDLEDYARRKYPEGDVRYFLMSNPVIPRKTIALSNFKYREYPKPVLKKPGLFNKKAVMEQNDILISDYNDFIRAQKEFIKSIGFEKWKATVQKIEKDKAWLSDMIIELSKEL